MSNIATTISQSRKLIELGLDPKTADMYYLPQVMNDGETLWPIDEGYDLDDADQPAWSLSALFDVMPKEETPYIQYLNEPPFDKEEYRWECGLYDFIGSPGSSPIEAAFQMVCWLLEQGLIKKGGEQ